MTFVRIKSEMAPGNSDWWGARGSVKKLIARWIAAALTLALLVSTAPGTAWAASYDATKIDPAFLGEVLADQTGSFDVIVRSTTSTVNDHVSRAANAVAKTKGKATHALGIVGGVSATLKGVQVLKLTRDADVDYVVKDAAVKAHFDPLTGTAKAGTPGILEVGAPKAWSQLGVTGRGIGVAVVDSGVVAHPDLGTRVVASIDFTSAAPTVSPAPLGDAGGHGSHVAGLVAGDGTLSGGVYTGVAPNANIISVRVIDATGASNISTVLRGLQWILANRATYNIRVANLSLGATPASSYKSDVLATAAEVLTFAGVAVVVAAGNTGPGASTITTPGTDPYVITVGAIDDNQTTTLGDDLMATWSSRGPTAFDNFSKPDLVAPGRKMVSLLSSGSTLDRLFPEREVTATGALSASYFMLSGTSMAAPVVAGTIALMLERTPSLTPAQIKRRLKSTATSLSFGTTFDRGVGMVNAYAAAASNDSGKDIAAGRVTNAFASDMRAYIQGQPITWRDLAYNNGVDSRGQKWSDITWEGITWDSVTWENISWESFTWSDITWNDITWEDITWESTDQLSTGALSGTTSGWDPVN